MDDLFNKAVKEVLKHEGKVSNDAHDPGGYTNYGISTRFAKEHCLNISVEDLTQDQAIEIYKKYFWIPYYFDDLTVESVVCKIFDTAVNIGPMPAIKIAQRVITKFYPSFQVDGIIGEDTANVLNHISDTFFLSNYREYLVHYYHSLVIHNPNLQKFLNGWISRAND